MISGLVGQLLLPGQMGTFFQLSSLDLNVDLQHLVCGCGGELSAHRLSGQFGSDVLLNSQIND